MKQWFFDRYRCVLHLGVRDSLTQEFIRRIHLTNQITLVVWAAAFFYFFIFLFLGKWVIAGLAAGFAVLFSLPLLLNHQGYYLTARMFLIVCGNLSIVIFALLFGRGAGFQLVIIPAVGLPIVLFEYYQYRYILFGIAFGVFSWLFLEVTRYQLYNHVLVSDMMVTVLYYSLNTLAFLVMILWLRFFYGMNLQVQKEIREAYLTSYQSMKYAEKISHQATYANLTRRIAHEIRNPLTVIQAATEMTLQHMDDKEQILWFMKMAQAHIDRMLRIIEIMLKYGDEMEHDFELFSLNEVVQDVLCLAEAKCKNLDIILDSHLDSLSEIKGDKNKVCQALLNVIYNAIEALPSGGTIMVSTKPARFVNYHQVAFSGGCVTIQDTGSGIKPEHLSKIYDPFFTTKHENMGLGLAITYRILDQHFGKIDVRSYEGQGTVCSLYFPFDPEAHELVEPPLQQQS